MMRERYEILDNRVQSLLKAFELATSADSGTGEITWLCDSIARAIREARKETVRLMEGRTV